MQEGVTLHVRLGTKEVALHVLIPLDLAVEDLEERGPDFYHAIRFHVGNLAEAIKCVMNPEVEPRKDAATF